MKNNRNRARRRRVEACLLMLGFMQGSDGLYHPGIDGGVWPTRAGVKLSREFCREVSSSMGVVTSKYLLTRHPVIPLEKFVEVLDAHLRSHGGRA